MRTIVLPLDDDTPAVTYAGTWTVVPTLGDDVHADYHHTDDVATPASFTFTFTGASVTLYGGDPCGTGAVTIDGEAAGTTEQACGIAGAPVFTAEGLDPAAPDTLAFTLTEGTFGLDAILVR